MGADWAPARCSNASDRRLLARVALVALCAASLVACATTQDEGIDAEPTGTTTQAADPANGLTERLPPASESGTDPAAPTPPASGDPARAPNAEVIRIVDGDTIVVRTDRGQERVRLIGIDTPESVDPRRPVECFGKEAARYTASLLPPGTPVTLERDAQPRDRYGRLLAYVYRSSDGLLVNEAIVAGGYAQVLTIPPNVTHAERFLAAERSARASGAGLWSSCP